VAVMEAAVVVVAVTVAVLVDSLDVALVPLLKLTLAGAR